MALAITLMALVTATLAMLTKTIEWILAFQKRKEMQTAKNPTATKALMPAIQKAAHRSRWTIVLVLFDLFQFVVCAGVLIWFYFSASTTQPASAKLVAATAYFAGMMVIGALRQRDV